VHAFPSLQAIALLTLRQPAAVSQLSVVHTLPSLQFTGVPTWHVPNAQTSPAVQAFPSSQGFAFAAFTQPVAGLQLSVVQRFASSQTTGVVTHDPPEQTSPAVQAFESEHGAVLSAWTHPVAVSQLSSVHGLPSLQLSAVPGRQAPNTQASPLVQALPSSQAIALLLNTQPVAGLQLSVVQRLASSHARGVPMHAPPEHASPVVQAL